MSLPAPLSRPDPVYPESDGKPMADNSIQFRWIVVLFTNLLGLFRDRLDVWVGGNLMWYPVQGEPGVNNAPDVFVVFGRPKGERSSYKQWEEEGVPLTVVFEILSPGNTQDEMKAKYLFYEEHGVEEYYVYDPDTNRLTIYRRRGSVFRRVRSVQEYVSPRLGIRFDLAGAEMTVYRPDGEPFLRFDELERSRAEARRQAEEAREQVARLAELSRKARRGQATAEELRELERLEDEGAPPSR